jgi:prepilin-type N-terminal cleavage/methylation domain-containing protein
MPYIRVARPTGVYRADPFAGADMKRNSNSSRGFSMIELLISILVMGIMIAITIIQMQPVVQQMHANTAMNLVLGQLRSARQLSIAQRRDIQIQFLGNNEIKITELPVAGVVGAPRVLSDLFLNPTVSFQLFGGMPDTPDAFGNNFPVTFAGLNGGPPTMMYQSDGTFVDTNGNPINGTVFLGVTRIPTSARAITLLGTTGQVRTYKGNGASWLQQ